MLQIRVGNVMARHYWGAGTMSYRGLKALLMACSGVAALVAATADANAGGLAVREQSAWGQGASFAGVAAGGSSSAMFWNPATMTQIPGIQSNSVLSGIMPYAANSPNVAASTFGALGGTGDSAQDALVPAAYYTWQIKPDLWIGMSVNSPFGLSVKEPGAWAGGGYGAYWTNLKTYNATPTIAYRINDWISIGAGVQVQYAQTTFGFAYNVLGAGTQAGLNGGGYGYGFTGGVTLTPTQNLTVGVGYRSGINQKLNGTLALPAAAGGTPGSINTTVNLPDIVTGSIRYRFAPQWTALGTVEWSHWSRIGTVNVLQPNGAPAIAGGSLVTLPFQYQDGWFFSGGAEYQWNERLALRSGVGYERSPVTDQVRMPLVPDNDRIWLSAGATYQYSNKISLDAAYTHVFLKSTSINISAASGNPWFKPLLGTYIGDVSSHVDIISVGFHYRWDNPAPAPVSTLPHK
jgi:long-chain fatty acid transport protein